MLNVRTLRVLMDLAQIRERELTIGEAFYREEAAKGDNVSGVLVRELEATREWLTATAKLVETIVEKV